MRASMFVWLLRAKSIGVCRAFIRHCLAFEMTIKAPYLAFLQTHRNFRVCAYDPANGREVEREEERSMNERNDGNFSNFTPRKIPDLEKNSLEFCKFLSFLGKEQQQHHQQQLRSTKIIPQKYY